MVLRAFQSLDAGRKAEIVQKVFIILRALNSCCVPWISQWNRNRMRENDSGPKLSERIVRCQEYCHRYVTMVRRIHDFGSGFATVCAHGCRMRPLSRNSILRVCPLNAWIKGFFYELNCVAHNSSSGGFWDIRRITAICRWKRL